MESNLYLIGMPGSGKTVTGNILAGHLGLHYVDTDDLIVKKAGKPIRDIFAESGEDYFRDLETEALLDVSEQGKQVVATGGGVVLNADNVKIMKEGGRIVWLRATPETIKTRMQRDTDTRAFRPALTSKGCISETEETLLAREPFYNRAMDFFVDTDDRPIDMITGTIIKNLIALAPGDIRI